MTEELRPSLQGSDANSDLVKRLKIAVRLGGGNKAVASRSGIKLGTLNNYVREVHRVPADAAAKIAATCNVSIDWLLRGEGPMEYLRIGQVTPEGVVEVGAGQILPEKQTPDAQLKLLGDNIDLDRLGRALREADLMFAANNKQPTDRQRMQATVIFYNHLTEAHEQLIKSEKPHSPESS